MLISNLLCVKVFVLDSSESYPYQCYNSPTVPDQNQADLGSLLRVLEMTIEVWSTATSDALIE